MRTMHKRWRWLRVAVMLTGTTFLMEGCDPGVRATVESGIINSSNSLLTSFMRAVADLAQGNG